MPQLALNSSLLAMDGIRDRKQTIGYGQVQGLGLGPGWGGEQVSGPADRSLAPFPH